ncbi:MAG: AraC family transcriptional regulator [Paenibacillaceae bacterium]
MLSLTTALTNHLIVPYIREADFAVRKPWSIAERRLLDYLFIYISEGKCSFHVAGTDYDLEQGSFCLIQPDDYHRLRGITSTITPYVHFDIFYHPIREHQFRPMPGLIDLTDYRHIIQPRLNDFSDIHVPVKFRSENPAFFQDTLLKLIGLVHNNQPIDRLEATHLLEGLIIRLIKEFSKLEGASTSTPDSLNWITSFLSLRLSEQISVSDMAERAQLSPSRFSALFRERFGMPPHRYLTHLRIQHAQTLMTNRELSITEIADYCGFSSVHHFAKVFKNVTGMTPGYYKIHYMARTSSST